MNSSTKPILFGNAYGLDTHGGFGGDIFHQDGICRNLGASQGGGAAFTFVMIEEPICLGYSRDSSPREDGKRYTKRHLSEVVNAICPGRRETNEILIIEPDKTMEQAEPQSCAIRTRAYAGKPAAIEMGKDVANALTSVQKDSMVAEPQQRTIAYKEMPNGNIRAYDPNTPDKRGISESQITNPSNEAPTVTTAHEPKIMEQTPRYRIRKLTPRECYRLMDVEDQYIDRLLTPTDDKGKPIIPKSQHYKLAGNSIVTSCLYHIFRRLFIDTKPTEPIQQTLF